MSSLLQIEKYNQRLESLEVVSYAYGFDIADVLCGSVAPSPYHPVVANVKLYDIGTTVIRAIKNLHTWLPDCYVTVAHESKAELTRIVTALPKTQLLFVGTLPADNSLEHRFDNTRKALGVGCAGALVDFDPTELAHDFPEAIFASEI